ncbi:flavodoxin family protein [Desulfosporosinus sp. OT]|uniref:flavodoxin family protein n=1 Tax=Desulfosporosinus sp. OT TaxID=913865 RepID=UPI000223AE42|nr:flavodoxin family protein [Desulfosporosinus sp. OT]EGW36189.1 putative iron-sulfur flavoprotein [Desulfosporosinus sp. OT]
MGIEILGISASPIPNSNMDQLVLQVLQTSGLDYEFVKLSHLNVGPCRACKACREDNICKVADDFPELAIKLQAAKGLVIGGYTPSGVLDSFTKTFIERLRSRRHLNGSTEQKYVVTIISGLSKQTRELALKAIGKELLMENVQPVAQLNIDENVPYLTMEDQPVWEMAAQSGKLLAQFITEEIECWLDYE